MYIRVKSTPNSPRRSVQLVESVRQGSSVKQRIIRHIGVANTEEELEQLRALGEQIKQEIELALGFHISQLKEMTKQQRDYI